MAVKFEIVSKGVIFNVIKMFYGDQTPFLNFSFLNYPQRQKKNWTVDKIYLK